MAKKRSGPKFRRETPAARREALVDATLRCLKQYGHKGVSVRRISAAAGVSIGLINHHFPSKSGLIAESYETLALSLQASIRRQAGRAQTPRERISSFFRASFAPDLLDPELFNVWLVFWSMVAHSPEIREVHDRTYGRYRATLEGLLGQLAESGAAPRFKLRSAAIALAALLDGLWVELSLSAATFKPREAIALCEDWVTALCNGGFPRLARPKEPAPRSAKGAAARARSTPRCYTSVQQRHSPTNVTVRPGTHGRESRAEISRTARRRG